MIAIDTDEKLNWLVNGIENGEIQLISRERTEEEWEEIRIEIAEYKAARQENKVSKELVFA